MMEISRTVAGFSPNNQYFAYGSPDGCLKIWETSSNILQHEYIPSSHLSASCCTLTWGPYTNASEQSVGKKKKSNGVASNWKNLNLIAIGTLSGEILLYSVNKGDLYKKLVGGHGSTVNDVFWCTEDDTLFSCSSDHHVVKWSVSKGIALLKWKAGKSAIYSVCAVNKTTVLTGSSSVLWWDVETQSVLKKFTGHATEVIHLSPFIFKDDDASETPYFVSGSVGDRVINVWQLKTEGKEQPVASFIISDEPSVVDVPKNVVKNLSFLTAVVTKDGLLHIFEHYFTRKLKKPLQPTTVIHVVSPADKVKKSRLIPIIAAKISDDLQQCDIAYGNLLRPTFEKINFRELNPETYLIREERSLSAPLIEEGVSKIKQPDRPSDVKILAPGYMTPSRPTEITAHRKRRQKETDVKDLPMEERLNALNLGKAPEGHEVQESVKSDSMVHLLLQGLQSKDHDLLTTVLQCGNETLINNTLKRLPLHCITKLLQELYKRITKQEQRHHPCLRWLKGLITVHLPYLMSCQDIDEYMGPIIQLIDARKETFAERSKVKQRLKTFLSQVSVTEGDLNVDPFADALLVYEDESTDDENDDVEPVDEDDSAMPEVNDSFTSSEESEENGMYSSDGVESVN